VIAARLFDQHAPARRRSSVGQHHERRLADDADDTFIFEAAFGADVITDFEIGFDGIVLAAGITAGDVTTRVTGDDVVVEVDFLGPQTITVLGAADLFDPGIDIQIAT
jgi:hypothetical protein